MKEVEYSNAVKVNDQYKMDSYKASLLLLKEDLAKTVKDFDSMHTDNSNGKVVDAKKPRKWQGLFKFSAATNKK